MTWLRCLLVIVFTLPCLAFPCLVTAQDAGQDAGEDEIVVTAPMRLVDDVEADVPPAEAPDGTGTEVATDAGVETPDARLRVLACPLDGERIEILSAQGCAFEGQRLDGRPVTSCADTTIVPDCPSSGLPLYRGFSASELMELGELIGSPGFAAVRERDRFTRAYWLERQLRPDGPHVVALLVLLDAYRDDADVANGDHMDALEATARRMREAEPEHPATLMAYANTAAWHLYAGREAQAENWLADLGEMSAMARGAAMLRELEGEAEAARDVKAVNDFAAYGEALQMCIGRTGEAGCRAEDVVERF